MTEPTLEYALNNYVRLQTVIDNRVEEFFKLHQDHPYKRLNYRNMHIEDFEIYDDDSVSIKIDTSSWGVYDYATIHTTVEELLLPDEVIKAEWDRQYEESKRKYKEDQKKAELAREQAKEKAEREEYARLKAKYEG